MQVSLLTTKTQAKISSNIFNFSDSRKATLRVAFQFSPVLMAIALSSICITFLFNIQPAGAAATIAVDQSEKVQPQTEYLPGVKPENEPKISRVFTQEVLSWESEILAWSERYHLDPNFIAVVMQIESCGHPEISSSAGANGLFQVMPFHFAPGENPLDPETNAKRGLNYLVRSLELAEGDQTLALAGYNGGHSVIQLGRDAWADETQRYVYWGTGILQDIDSGNSHSLRLDEWLRAGGESLCRLAAAHLDS